VADRIIRSGRNGLIDVKTGLRLRVPDAPRFLDIGDLNVFPGDVLHTTEAVARGVEEVVDRGAFSVLLGGDHYLGYPSCLGFCRSKAAVQPNVRVGYIHIDGHLDFSDVGERGDTISARYNNGANARRISEIDVISPSNMVWIGIQGPCALEPLQVIRRNGGKVYTSDDIEEFGPEEIARRAGEWASRGCDYIYLSFDIDVIDAGFSNGTGSVTMGTLSPLALMRLLNELRKWPIAAMDLVETSPEVDPSSRTPAMSAEALVRLIGPRVFDIS
jgi:agmatinase